MTGFLSQLGIREARALAHSCPLGTSGRIHALRLRRRFQSPTVAVGGVRKQSTTAEAERLLEKEVTDDEVKRLQNEIRNTVRANFKAPEAAINGSGAELTINGEPLDIAQFAPHGSEKAVYPPMYRPRKLREHKKYDQFFYDYTQLLVRAPEANPDAPAPPPIDALAIAAEVDKVLETGDHHTALVAIGRLQSLPPSALSEVQPEKFTALLELMDAKYFFGDHIRFDTYVPSANPFYVEFFPENYPKNHPRNVFSRLLFKIIKARKEAGWNLSQADQLFVLRTRRILGEVSRIPLTEQFHKRGFPNDIQAFNDLMGSLVEGGVWAAEFKRKKQITEHWWPRSDEAAKDEQLNKGRIAYIFEKLTERRIQPNEETMCLMMTAFAREGDMESIKQIFDSAWGINIYKFLALGEEGIGRDFAHEDPMRPSGRLITIIAHIFGTNQDIPLALRLMDFVSRRYEIEIPASAWEETLERTYILSKRKTADKLHSTSSEHPRKPLPRTSVHSLWETMISPPYSVQPNVHMYDKVIRSLIGAQRFNAAEELMEEGRVVHKDNVRRHRALLKGWNWHGRNPEKSTAAQRIAHDHRIWLGKMEEHRSRQYLRAWVQALILKSDRNEWCMWESGNYMSGVVERWKLFLPRRVSYELLTGVVELRHDGKALNRKRAEGFVGRGRDGMEMTKMILEEQNKRAAEGGEGADDW